MTTKILVLSSCLGCYINKVIYIYIYVCEIKEKNYKIICGAMDIYIYSYLHACIAHNGYCNSCSSCFFVRMLMLWGRNSSSVYGECLVWSVLPAWQWQLEQVKVGMVGVLDDLTGSAVAARAGDVLQAGQGGAGWSPSAALSRLRLNFLRSRLWGRASGCSMAALSPAASSLFLPIYWNVPGLDIEPHIATGGRGWRHLCMCVYFVKFNKIKERNLSCSWNRYWNSWPGIN